MASDPAALVLLALEVGPLVRDLATWEPVAMMAEQVRDAATGADSLGDRDVARLRAWTRRWHALPDGLREFYVGRAPHVQACSFALWHVLDGTTHQATRSLQGAVHTEYRQAHGHSPPWSLLPRVP
jgi:hypothetical protein